MLVFGHRGARGHAPENTILGVRRAVELGVDWVEVDVHAHAGAALVIHDARLERTTDGAGRLQDHDLTYLRSLDAGAGEGIPRLEEVLDAIPAPVGLNVELKGPGTPAVVAALVRARPGWSAERLLVSSFDHRLVAEFQTIAPEVPTGALLVGLPIDDAAFAARLGVRSVHPSVDFVDQRFVDDAHARGLAVYVFTVNEPDDVVRMRELGVDGVFTDFPERV